MTTAGWINRSHREPAGQFPERPFHIKANDGSLEISPNREGAVNPLFIVLVLQFSVLILSRILLFKFRSYNSCNGKY